MLHDGGPAWPGPLAIVAIVGKLGVRMSSWRGTGGQTHLGGRTSQTGGSAPLSAGGSRPSLRGIAKGGRTETGGTTGIGGVGGSPEQPDLGIATDGRSTGGTLIVGGNTATGGSLNGQDASPRDTAHNGGASTGGTAAGGALTSGGNTTSGGTTTTGGRSSFTCLGSTNGYDTLMVKSGTTWSVTHDGVEKYLGNDTTAALTATYDSLTEGRRTKQSILVQGNGEIPATSQVLIPSDTVLNWCGTLNVSGTPTGSDRSPLYARNQTDIHIPNLKMTGSPQYGIFFRGTNRMHLGRIDLKLTSAAGIGIRVDTSGSAGKDTTFVSNDTTNTNNGTYPPSENVAIKNLVLSGGASVRQDWCDQPGKNGCSATNEKGGTVTMCPWPTYNSVGYRWQ